MFPHLHGNQDGFRLDFSTHYPIFDFFVNLDHVSLLSTIYVAAGAAGHPAINSPYSIYRARLPSNDSADTAFSCDCVTAC